MKTYEVTSLRYDSAGGEHQEVDVVKAQALTIKDKELNFFDPNLVQAYAEGYWSKVVEVRDNTDKGLNDLLGKLHVVLQSYSLLAKGRTPTKGISLEKSGVNTTEISEEFILSLQVEIERHLHPTDTTKERS